MSGQWKKQRLQDHFVVLCNDLDVDRIVPVLRSEKMLTSDEVEQLTNRLYSTRARREKLLLFLPRKGRAHFEKFAECLVWSGQKELAVKIGIPTDTLPPSPYPPVPPTSSLTDQQEQFFKLLAGITSGSLPISPPHFPVSVPSAPHSYAQPQPTISPLPPPPHSQPTPTANLYPRPHTHHNPLGAYAQPSHHHHSPPPPPSIHKHSSQTAALPCPQNVFILYCNDPFMSTTQGEDFAYDVLSLADFLIQNCGRGIKFDFDGHDHFPPPPNWAQWTEECIERSDLVLFVCSPTLIEKLKSQHSETVSMRRAMFYSLAVYHLINPEKFVPIFINVDPNVNLVPDVHSKPYCEWVPSKLQGATHYWLNLRALDAALGEVEGVADMVVRERTTELLSQQRFAPLRDLLSRLTGVANTAPPPASSAPLLLPAVHSPATTVTGLPPPTPGLTFTDSELMTIAERIPRDWQDVGIKLGVMYTTLESIRVKNAFDSKQAAMEMLSEWRRRKGEQATRSALREALVAAGYRRVAQEVFGRD